MASGTMTPNVLLNVLQNICTNMDVNIVFHEDAVITILKLENGTKDVIESFDDLVDFEEWLNAHSTISWSST